ncbi:Salicylate carboxymethyltransferase, partial [Linum grandiflorum]
SKTNLQSPHITRNRKKKRQRARRDQQFPETETKNREEGKNQMVEMKVDEVLHMNGGAGESSYAFNSLLQRKAISMTKSIADEAITQLVRSSTFPPKIFTMADLGCGSGPNTFLAVSGLVKSFFRISKNFDKEIPKEFHILLNDLPQNDFNNIFNSLREFKKQMTTEMGEFSTMFLNGVPGSFYGRLFPAGSLHFVHSSYSLHWLSRVPDGLDENGGNITITSSSPRSVFEAYYGQFRTDFSSFLKCRAAEVVKGGRMVLTLLGRRNEDSWGRECYCIWEVMSIALNQMAHKGFISKERLKSFNVPLYMPSPMEVQVEVQEEGSFAIDKLEVSEVSWNNPYEGEVEPENKDGGVYHVASCMRAVAEPLLTYHFGSDSKFIDEVFRKYREIVSEWMVSGNTSCFNLTVSLVKY